MTVVYEKTLDLRVMTFVLRISIDAWVRKSDNLFKLRLFHLKNGMNDTHLTGL